MIFYTGETEEITLTEFRVLYPDIFNHESRFLEPDKIKITVDKYFLNLRRAKFNSQSNHVITKCLTKDN